MKVNELFKKIEAYNELIPFVNGGVRRIAVYIDIDGMGVKNPCSNTYTFCTFYEFTCALFDDFNRDFVAKVLSAELEEQPKIGFYIKTDEIDVTFDIWPI